MDGSRGDRSIVVTGATSGIGLAVAEALAQYGVSVIGVGRDPQRCLAAEERLRAMERVPMERVLPVTYEELTGGQEQAEELEPTVGRKLCAFLDVDYAPMPTRLVRIHRGPVAALVSNWRELRDALLQSRYPEVATGEARWSC